MRTEDLMPIGTVGVHFVCPRCRRASVVRSSEKVATRLNGSSLWEFSESCIMKGCGWTRSVPNVKIGA